MMTEQDEDEVKVRWLVDAEVKLAMEDFRAAESQRTAGTQGTAHVMLTFTMKTVSCNLQANDTT